MSVCGLKKKKDQDIVPKILFQEIEQNKCKWNSKAKYNLIGKKQNK